MSVLVKYRYCTIDTKLGCICIFSLVTALTQAADVDWEINPSFSPVLHIRIRRIRLFLGHPDPLVRGIDPDHSIIKQK